jgi:transposase
MSIYTSLEERLQMVACLEAGEAVWRVAHRLGWRPATVRKWRRRYQQAGRAGLLSQLGRPKKGALSSFPKAIRETLGQWRQAHPGWGATTLRAELWRAGEEKLPSRAAIARFLNEQKLTKSYDKHSPLPPAAPLLAKAHELWEMDACGYRYVPEVGIISLINLNDRSSHLRLLSYPCYLGESRAERHASTEDYQAALRLAFSDWGLPAGLQVDHDSVFFENRSASPFPTRLHRWLLALGISLRFGRYHRPTDQAMTERSHQLWTAQVLEGQCFSDWQALYRALQERRGFLNEHLPCAGLQDQPPLVACPQARHSGRGYRPEWEWELLELSRVYAYLAKGRWFRRVGTNGTISLGGEVYYVGTAWQRQQLEITFQLETQELRFMDEAGDMIKQLPLQGSSKASLMGEILPYVRLPVFQPSLPFTWKEQRVLRLFETIP